MMKKQRPRDFDELDADPASFENLLDGKRVLWAPFFQRQYVWSKADVDTLFSDVDNLVREVGGEARTHFLGTVILQKVKDGAGGKPDVYWIIDGQQRLTTVFLVALAAHSIAPTSEAALEFATLFRLGGDSAWKQAPRVVPTTRDTRQLQMVIKGVDLEFDLHQLGRATGPREGHLLDAFLHCKEELVRRARAWEEDETVDHDDSGQADRFVTYVDDFISNVRSNLLVVEVLVPSYLDSTQVFESINGRGKKLTVGDLARNLVAQKFGIEDRAEAEKLFKNQWLPLEESLGSNLEDYLFVVGLQDSSQVSKGGLYRHLSAKWASWSGSQCMDYLEKYGDAYRWMVMGSKPSKAYWGRVAELSEAVACFQLLQPPAVCRSYTVRLVHEALNGTVATDDAIAALRLVESFLVRRAAVGYEPTGLHALFKALWGSGESGSKADVSKIRAELKRRDTIKLPTDASIQDELPGREFYRSKVARFVLFEFELGRTKHKNAPMSLFTGGEIDHIMPQSQKGGWKKAGSEAQRDRALHTIGNLVLIEGEENRSKGSAGWDETRKRYKNETYSKVAHKLADNKMWTVEIIDNRSQSMATWFCQRWPDPMTAAFS